MGSRFTVQQTVSGFLFVFTITITIKFVEWQQQHVVETLLNMNKRYVKIL
jgi:hypothetical protein